jgi:hypothetical protein
MTPRCPPRASESPQEVPVVPRRLQECTPLGLLDRTSPPNILKIKKRRGLIVSAVP